MCLYVGSEVMLAAIFQNDTAQTMGVTFSQLDSFSEKLQIELSAPGGLWLDYCIKEIREMAFERPNLFKIEGNRIYLNTQNKHGIKILFQNIKRYSPEEQSILSTNAKIALDTAA